MIYFIGGASRAGKTYLAKRLMVRLGIPVLELDYLKMGLANGLPEYGVHPLKDELTVGRLLWPIVSGMITAMVENEDDYIIEGCYILPEYAARTRKQYGSGIRSCFLGYADAVATEKLAEVRRYDGGAGNPLGDLSALSDIEHFVSFSQYVRAECSRLGLTYIEAKDRDLAVNLAVESLLKNKIGEQSLGYDA